MSTPIIQVEYDTLESIAARFDRASDRSDALWGRLQGCANQLRQSWQGAAAIYFFTEMEDDVLPALSRLGGALSDAAKTAREIGRTMRAAEEEAAALFKGEFSGTPKRGNRSLSDSMQLGGPPEPDATATPAPLVPTPTLAPPVPIPTPAPPVGTPVPLPTPVIWDSCAGQGVACYRTRWYEAHGYELLGEGWVYTGAYHFRDGQIAREVLGEAGITLAGEYWNPAEVIEIAAGACDLASRIGTDYTGLQSILTGPVVMHHGQSGLSGSGPWHSCFGGAACAPPPPFSDGRTIYWDDAVIDRYTTVHELAHIIDWNNGFRWDHDGDRVADGPPMPLSNALPPTDPNRPHTDYALENIPRTRWEDWAEAVTVWEYGNEYWRYERDLTPDQQAFLNHVFGGMRWQE